LIKIDQISVATNEVSKNPKKTVSVDCWIALPASCRQL